MRTFQYSGWHPWLPACKQRVPLSLTIKAWQKTGLRPYQETRALPQDKHLKGGFPNSKAP